MSNLPNAQIGVIGGSGFDNLLNNTQEIELKTKYGQPSAKYMVGEYKGKKIAFLQRHGVGHVLPPHMIPYKANIQGFKDLGVKFIISPSAAGSLQPEVRPGDFVICDQFVDRTKNREDTFYNGPKTVHIPMDEPYCDYLRQIAINSGKELNYRIHEKGTVVVINGPRFSTDAESDFYRKQGWKVINMTQYPEVTLAREAEIAFINISLITDYDTGLKDDENVEPVTISEVIKIFNKNNENVKKLIFRMIELIDVNKKCSCQDVIEAATI